MANMAVLGALLASFATLVTAHVAIAVRLFFGAKPRYRGILALIVPPLAPMWAHRERWRKLCWTWVGAVLVYASLLAVASLLRT